MQGEPDEASRGPPGLVMSIIEFNDCSIPVEADSSREVHVMLR